MPAMSKISRRTCMHVGVAALSAGGVAPGGEARAAARPGPNRKPHPRGRGSIKLCEVLGLTDQHRLKLARQVGLNHAIAGVSGALSKVPRTEYVATLAKVKADYQAAGFTIAGVESHPVPAEKIKLGLDGRDEEIENYIAAI